MTFPFASEMAIIPSEDNPDVDVDDEDECEIRALVGIAGSESEYVLETDSEGDEDADDAGGGETVYPTSDVGPTTNIDIDIFPSTTKNQSIFD